MYIDIRYKIKSETFIYALGEWKWFDVIKVFFWFRNYNIPLWTYTNCITGAVCDIADDVNME